MRSVQESHVQNAKQKTLRSTLLQSADPRVCPMQSSFDSFKRLVCCIVNGYETNRGQVLRYEWKHVMQQLNSLHDMCLRGLSYGAMTQMLTVTGCHRFALNTTIYVLGLALRYSNRRQV